MHAGRAALAAWAEAWRSGRCCPPLDLFSMMLFLHVGESGLANPKPQYRRLPPERPDPGAGHVLSGDITSQGDSSPIRPVRRRPSAHADAGDHVVGPYFALDFFGLGVI